MDAFKTEFAVSCMQIPEPIACKQVNEHTEGRLAQI